MVKLLLDLRRATSHIPLGVRRFIEGDLLSVNLEEYPHSRADADVWLGQLQGNSLFCDCTLRGSEECHAAIVERWSLSVDQTVLPSSGSTLRWGSLGCVTGGRSIADSQGCVGDAQRQCVSLSEEHQHRVSVSLRNGGDNAVHIRLFQANWTLEVFAGTCIITSILAEWDVPPASLVANLIHEWMDLLNPIFVHLLLGLLLEGQPHLVFVVGTTVWCC